MHASWGMSLRTLCRCYILQTEATANIFSNMPIDSLKHLVAALLAQLPDDPSSIGFSVKSENDEPAPTNGQSTKSGGPLYDPAMVYLLELCTVLALRDQETVAALGADVAEALQNVLRHAASYHFITISRTLFYLLHLLHASYVSSSSSPTSSC
jgi:brefeldin A-resistance guanine nucleotide exchange factor 1